MKIRQVGAEFYADEQTDRVSDMTLRVAFRNFPKAPKIMARDSSYTYIRM
jgi:hypothetical protein